MVSVDCVDLGRAVKKFVPAAIRWGRSISLCCYIERYINVPGQHRGFVIAIASQVRAINPVESGQLDIVNFHAALVQQASDVFQRRLGGQSFDPMDVDFDLDVDHNWSGRYLIDSDVLANEVSLYSLSSGSISG